MDKKANLYPNLLNFFKTKGFLVKSISEVNIEIMFSDKEVNEVYDKFFELHKIADKETDIIKQDELYDKSWELLNNVEKIYYPKLQPILELLNNFYKNSSTPLEFKLIFENDSLTHLSLGANPLFYDMYLDKKFFNENIVKEFENLDIFLKDK